MDKYDPMTGELLSETTEEGKEEKKITGYDPMTGEPIYEGANEKNEETKENRIVIGYNPMSGEPIYEGETTTGVQVKSEKPARNFNPMTGKPEAAKGKNKTLIAIAGGVLLVAVLAFAVIKSGLFLSKADKVLAAVANTFDEQSHMVKELGGLSILSANNYTVNVEADVESTYIDLQYATKSSDKQISGKFEARGIPEVEFLAGITSSEVKAQIPEFTDYVFTYNYKKDKNGYITEMLKDDEIEAIDSMCEALYSEKEKKDISKSIAKIISKEYHSLKFEKVKKETFEINGKERKCSGYKTTITEDNFVNILDKTEDLVEKEYKEAFDKIEVEDLFDDLRDEFKGMPEIEVTFYIYKNEIACISLEVEREEVQILFKGNKKGMHNIEIATDYGTICELKGSVKGSEEKYQLMSYGSEIASLEYDYKTGEFVLDMSRYGSMSVEGNLQSGSKEMKFAIDEIRYYGNTEDFTCKVSLKKGASMQKFKGDKFDIGNASEDDFEDLQDDISSYLY